MKEARAVNDAPEILAEPVEAAGTAPEFPALPAPGTDAEAPMPEVPAPDIPEAPPEIGPSEEPSSDTPSPDKSSPGARGFLAEAYLWLRGVLPLLLAGFAAAVFTGTAVLLILRLRPTPDLIARILLSPAAGGGEIRAVEGDPGPMTASLPRVPPDLSLASAEPAETAAETGPASDSLYLSPPREEAEEPEEPQEPQEPDASETAPASDPPEGSAGPRFPMTNETGYSPDEDAVLLRGRAVPALAVLRTEFGEDAPLALILHTHTTEGYLSSSAQDYRTTDPAESVVAVGDALARRLCEAGIPTLHLTDIFDAPDFNLAYYNASRAIRQTLADHPSIRYIFDVHRDSITLPDGSPFACVTEIGGERAGRLMFVVGTDAAGADHPAWEDNLALAMRLQASAEEAHPGLMRDINLRTASFNEQYAPGALLIEAGSTGCTTEEAVRGMELLADAIVGEIYGGGITN